MAEFRIVEDRGVALLVYGPSDVAEAKVMPRQVAWRLLRMPWDNEQEKSAFLKFLNHPTGESHASDTTRHGNVPSEDNAGPRQEGKA